MKSGGEEGKVGRGDWREVRGRKEEVSRWGRGRHRQKEGKEVNKGRGRGGQSG